MGFHRYSYDGGTLPEPHPGVTPQLYLDAYLHGHFPLVCWSCSSRREDLQMPRKRDQDEPKIPLKMVLAACRPFYEFVYQARGNGNNLCSQEYFHCYQHIHTKSYENVAKIQKRLSFVEWQKGNPSRGAEHVERVSTKPVC